MAAVTVEDCLKIIPNRFELSLVASYRAKQIMNGSPQLYVSDKVEKPTVVALREIAADLVDIEKIREDIKNNIQNQTLFKSFDDGSTYDAKKDTELENLSSSEISGELEDEGDLGEDEDITEEEDESYYDNIGDETIEDDASDEEK